MKASEFRDKADSFTKAYVEAALWSSTNDNDKPMDSEYSIEEIAETTLDRIVADCAKFQADHAELLSDIECKRNSREYSTDEQAGHDFWLTRNGHGAGFWDGDWLEPQATILDKASKAFGEINLYIGDDGLIYA